MKVNKGMLIASAAAVLVLSGAVQAKAEEKAADENVKCAGINECKGHGACAGPNSSCAGANSCKGQGVVMVPKAECEQKGGKVVP
jgi:uncharacterized membrane protein